MYLSDFDFPFDPDLIALHPVEPRDLARLLVLQRAKTGCLHKKVKDLVDLLAPNDLVVVNDTKVLPVRLVGKKQGTGGQVEMVLLRDIGGDIWEVLLKGRVRPGLVLDLGEGAKATIQSRGAEQTTVHISAPVPVRELIQRIGSMPLPPYIKRKPDETDRRSYQTVFAEHEGAIAAPTAGLHFTPTLVDALEQKGVHVATLTLHVGPGTFLPVKTQEINEHQMHAEEVEVPRSTVEWVTNTKQDGGRVIAVGTTVVRGLESSVNTQGEVQPFVGATNLFITPGYRFQVIDGLLTNFHMPRSTLLMLVSAFAGYERLQAAYSEAMKERYRLYSYGDAMLIL